MVDLADIFSTLGTIISFILSFTPTVPFMKVFKKEEKIDILPEGLLLFLILNRLVWGSVWILTGRNQYGFEILYLEEKSPDHEYVYTIGINWQGFDKERMEVL